MTPARTSQTASGGIFSSSHCTNAPALEQPSQEKRCRNVVRGAEFRPPIRHAWIGYDGSMGEIENAMRRQCKRGNPEGPPETCYRGGDEDGAGHTLKNERMCGSAHGSEQCI